MELLSCRQIHRFELRFRMIYSGSGIFIHFPNCFNAFQMFSRVFSTFLIFCCACSYATSNAFISILSSDGFLLPAKIVAHRLQLLNSSIPFILLVTEDISPSTIETLSERGVVVRHIHKIDTPYLSTHPGAKFAYTKIRLWSLIEYDTLFYLDLDTLPVGNLAAAFDCGSFCAVFRHSDLFNCGIFVMKPNKTIYEDMLEKSGTLESYDGGDQGFFNSYFSNLKYAPMFNDGELDHQKYTATERKLSAAYNYDIGMYYLNNGRKLVTPKIIHFTMGPLKPWVWWTYPLFDLNRYWLDARTEMESTYAEENPDKYLVLYGALFFAVMIALREFILCLAKEKCRSDVLSPLEHRLMPHMICASSILLSFHLTPLTAYPTASWMYFSVLTVVSSIFAADVYVKLRLGSSNGTVKMAICCSLALSLFASSWNFLTLVPSFGTRALFTFPIAVGNIIVLSIIIRRSIFGHPYNCARYQPLPVIKDCVQ